MQASDTPSRKVSNASTVLDFADALDSGPYERRHVPTTPELYSVPGPSTNSLPSQNVTRSHSNILSGSISNSNLSAFGGSSQDGSPATPPAALHAQPSFSDVRRAMMQGRLRREHSSTLMLSDSNRDSEAPSSSAPTADTGPPTSSGLATLPERAIAASAAESTSTSFVKSQLPSIPPTPPEGALNGSIPTVSRQGSRRNLKERDPEKPRIRTTPHLHNFQAKIVSPAFMHWSRAPVHGVMPRRGLRAHTTTVVNKTAWLFGGTDDSKCYNDIWCLDLETLMWSHPPMQGDIPPPCRAHSATAVMNQIILFGGGDGANYYNHLYLLDTTRFRWTRFNPRGVLPPPRRAHTCVMWDKRIFVFGGGTGAQALGDLWSLDVTEHPDNWEWVCLRTNPEPLRVANKAKTEDDVYKRARVHDHGGVGPSPRGYHTAAAVHSKMVVVGGSNGSQCYNDVWIFDLDSGLWQEVIVANEEIPKPRLLGHTATQVGFYLFVIGGHNTSKYTNDVRLLNMETMKYEMKTIAGRPPSSRAYHGAVYYDGRMFLLGGYDGVTAFSDVWILDLASHAYLTYVTDFAVYVDGETVGDDDGTEGGYFIQ